MTLWNCWIVVRLFLIPMIGGISYKRRQWLIWGYGDTRLPSLRTRGPKCHTSQGRNVTQAGPKCHTRAKISHSHVKICCIHLSTILQRLPTYLYPIMSWKTMLLNYCHISRWPINYNLASLGHMGHGLIRQMTKRGPFPTSSVALDAGPLTIRPWHSAFSVSRGIFSLKK